SGRSAGWPWGWPAATCILIYGAPFRRYFSYGPAGGVVGRGPQAQAALPGAAGAGGRAAGTYSRPAAAEARA
nr:hypothetical protein [Tanacetum cinerariifolium]